MRFAIKLKHFLDSKRILIWSSSYAPVLGGLQRMLEQLAQEWQKQGHQVLVLTNKYPYSLPSIEHVNGIAVNRLVHVNPKGKGLKSLLLKLLYPIQSNRIIKCIYNFKPDKVYVQFPSAQLPYLKKAYEVLPKKEWYLCFHGHDILRHYHVDQDYTYNHLLVSPDLISLQQLLKQCNFEIIACSNWLAQRVKQSFNQACKVVYNAVDTSIFKQVGSRPIEQKYFFAFGRLEQHKGFHLLIQAYQESFDSFNSSVNLIIAGSGPYLAELKSLVLPEFTNRIQFVGTLNSYELAQYGHFAESIWVPSLREPFGIAVLEAMAMNAKVYASNIGGIPEAGSDLINYFTPNVEDLKLKIKSSFHKNYKLDYMRNSESVYIESFTTERMAFGYLYNLL